MEVSRPTGSISVVTTEKVPTATATTASQDLSGERTTGDDPEMAAGVVSSVLSDMSLANSCALPGTTPKFSDFSERGSSVRLIGDV
ncbi:hypothetical protein TPA0910_58050 [Streptomyces hygroscopicus subsp. sporocinereus]|uniref:Uncharacterized protein n=1 Tax=Streptomyces hygroscopicus TaxID=1912 RepID=A0ABQ3U6Z2_STRHY|nr:hypothetical protein TPA0910_58050 [Streptomyces hygroscopicus]